MCCVNWTGFHTTFFTFEGIPCSIPLVTDALWRLRSGFIILWKWISVILTFQDLFPHFWKQCPNSPWEATSLSSCALDGYCSFLGLPMRMIFYPSYLPGQGRHAAETRMTVCIVSAVAGITGGYCFTAQDDCELGVTKQCLVIMQNGLAWKPDLELEKEDS